MYLFPYRKWYSVGRERVAPGRTRDAVPIERAVANSRATAYTDCNHRQDGERHFGRSAVTIAGP